jgi:transposase
MRTLCERKKTLFVGIDVHKNSHTAVGVSPFGEKLFELTVGNYEKDFRLLSDKTREVANTTSLSPYLGLEDCQGYGERLALFLTSEGYPVVHVPAVFVDHARKRNTHPEKNDSLDARGVTEVMIQKIDTLPTYTLTEEAKIAKDIKDISLDREYLVKERTRIKNQLHTLFYRGTVAEYPQTTFENATINMLSA